MRSPVRVARWLVIIAECLLLVSWCYPAGVLADNSITPTATLTSIGSSSISPSYSSPSPSLSPSPSPLLTPFLEYVMSDILYIRIEEMIILIYNKTDQKGYYNLTTEEYPALMAQASEQNASLSDKGVILEFWKNYKYNKTHQSNTTFSFNFTFELEPTSTDQTWYISSFSHRNRSMNTNATNTTCTFRYTGMSQAVHAPSDISYYCSDMTFRGSCVDGIASEVQFKGLWIQAFQLKNRKPSSTYIDCGAKDHNNSIINVVVGSVVGSTLAIALIVIVVTLTIKLIKKRARWRGYNLLDD